MQQAEEGMSWERLRGIASLFGQELPDGMDVERLIETVQRFQKITSFLQQNAEEETALVAQEAGGVQGSRTERILQAALPYMDGGMGHQLKVMMRAMSLFQAISGQDAVIESRSRREESPHMRQRQMLKAMRVHLMPQERAQLDMFIRLMDMRSLIEGEDA